MRLSRGSGLVSGCARRIEAPGDWRLGMLTMPGYAGRREVDIMRVCRCDCGQVGTKAGRNLTGGQFKSCGFQ